MLPKVNISNSLPEFCLYKKAISSYFALFILENTAFVCEYAMWLRRLISQEIGWDTGVGRSSSAYPNSRILILNPLADKAGQKNLTKIECNELN
jgi:hypothetical protein